MIVFDLDGTLSNLQHRLHHIENLPAKPLEERLMDEHEREFINKHLGPISHDPPATDQEKREALARILKAQDEGETIASLTAERDALRAEVKWRPIETLLDTPFFEVWLPTDGINEGLAVPAIRNPETRAITLLAGDVSCVAPNRPTHWRSRSKGPALSQNGEG